MSDDNWAPGPLIPKIPRPRPPTDSTNPDKNDPAVPDWHCTPHGETGNGPS
ncbi:hypothetical protein [Kitasatospora sp. NPDC057223]|uniref:hypothetical protein n=1 Tax=Kitasatospora sp. NPDC057223 TaxID=3346055 RepID=UPI00363C4D43